MPEVPGAEGAQHAAGGAQAFITKRVGPLPLWAWAAAVGGAFLLLRLVAPRAGQVGGGQGAGGVGTPGFGTGGSRSAGGAATTGPATPGNATGTPSVIPQALPPILITILQAPATLSQPDVVPAPPTPKPAAPVVTTTAPTTTVVTSPYKPPVAGGPVYTSPNTPGFQAPFVAPQVSTITTYSPTYDPYGLKGNLPAGAKLQIVGGVPISLSEAGVAEPGGGIPAKDVPVAVAGQGGTTPSARVRSSSLGAAPLN